MRVGVGGGGAGESLELPPEVETGSEAGGGSVGRFRFTFVPSPSCPVEFSPQQYVVAPARPQVWEKPVGRRVNESDPTTAVGTEALVVEPIPNRPSLFLPQQ
jgi:hypothetical protein